MEESQPRVGLPPEEDIVEEEHAPVRAAYRCMDTRQDQPFYDQALKAQLPIGSGMIESGHKHVLQARLKKPARLGFSDPPNP